MDIVDLSIREEAMHEAQKRTTQWTAVAALILTILGWVGSMVMYYNSDTVELKQRVTVLETKQTDLDRRLERMEQKIDRLLERSGK